MKNSKLYGAITTFGFVVVSCVLLSAFRWPMSQVDAFVFLIQVGAGVIILFVNNTILKASLENLNLKS